MIRAQGFDNGGKRLGRVCQSATDELVILGTYSPLSGSVNSVKWEWQALPWCSCSSQVENVVRSQPSDHFKAGAPARAIMPFSSPCSRAAPRLLPPLTQTRSVPPPPLPSPVPGSAAPSPGRHRSWRSLQPARRRAPENAAAAAILEAGKRPTAGRRQRWVATSASPAQWEFSPLARGARCAAGGCGESRSELRAAGERSSDGPWAPSSQRSSPDPFSPLHRLFSHFQPRPSAETWPCPPPWGPQLGFARRNPVWGAALALSPLGPLEWWLRPFPGCLISRAAGPGLRPGGQRWAGDREIGVWDPLLLAVMTLSLRPSLQTSGKPKFPSWGSLEPQVVNLNTCLPRTSKVLSWYNWVFPNLPGWKSHQDAC